MKFRSVTLTNQSKVSIIDRNQFLTSNINSINLRLVTDASSSEKNIINEFLVLESIDSPANIDIGFGGKEIELLCNQFHLST